MLAKQYAYKNLAELNSNRYLISWQLQMVTPKDSKNVKDHTESLEDWQYSPTILLQRRFATLEESVCCEMDIICDRVCDTNACFVAKFPAQYIYDTVMDIDIGSKQLEINKKLLSNCEK